MKEKFTFDEQELAYIPIKQNKWLKCLLLGLLIACLAISIVIVTDTKEIPQIEREILIILAKKNEFSEKKFIEQLKSMNLNFPQIAHAQAWQETGGFTSRLFKENNNLFGSQHPLARVTLSKGEKDGFAYFDEWQESVYDYGLYNATYLWRIKDEDVYFNYLKSYAQDSMYVNKIRRLVKIHAHKFE